MNDMNLVIILVNDLLLWRGTMIMQLLWKKAFTRGLPYSFKGLVNYPLSLRQGAWWQVSVVLEKWLKAASWHTGIDRENWA